MKRDRDRRTCISYIREPYVISPVRTLPWENGRMFGRGWRRGRAVQYKSSNDTRSVQGTRTATRIYRKRTNREPFVTRRPTSKWAFRLSLVFGHAACSFVFAHSSSRFLISAPNIDPKTFHLTRLYFFRIFFPSVGSGPPFFPSLHRRSVRANEAFSD